MTKGLMTLVGKLGRDQRLLYADCKARLEARTDAEARACVEAVLAGKHLEKLPGKLQRRSKGDPYQGSILSDESRTTRIHTIREERLKRWRLMN